MTEADRQRLRGSVRVHEDYRRSAYHDSKGFLTIGYGRMVDERRGGGITKVEAEYLLGNDLRDAEMACESLPAYLDLSPARQAVLIEMTFNMGPSKVREFKRMLSALIQQDFEHAASEMLDSEWATDVKGRAVQLAEQMKTGQWS